MYKCNTDAIDVQNSVMRRVTFDDERAEEVYDVIVSFDQA